MKDYPSIQGSSKAPRQPCYGFYKYDGSNLRAEWSSKRGWYKYGSRTQLFDQSHPILGRAIPLFEAKYGDTLPAVFRQDKHFRGVKNCIVFFEFFGSKSFAGIHLPDDKYDVVLFDVNPTPKGFMGPHQFLDTFGHLDVAELVFQGNMGENLIQSVRSGVLPDGTVLDSKFDVKAEVPEGIICKGGDRHDLWRCKIKTNKYLEALKERFQGDWTKYWE